MQYNYGRLHRFAVDKSRDSARVEITVAGVHVVPSAYTANLSQIKFINE